MTRPLASSLCIALVASALSARAAEPEHVELPAAWREAWQDPPAADRPLQIVHGIPAARASVERMRYYKDRGLGGIVANVDFNDYMQSEKHWQTLIDGVAACRELGMVVWLYDEKGYPSGSAGGLVLARNPEFEALALAFDPSKPDPFVVRPAYEHTHASNNYHAARRYANLLDADAVACFLDVTHEAYRKRLGPEFGRSIEAMFTDEPSLMAVNIGQIPDSVRARVRVEDPVDPDIEPLASVPWSRELPDEYQNRYGQNLMPVRRSLFEGDTADDRRVRRQFWSLVADLVADRYYGQIARWCATHRVASSGHKLHEESILHHVPLDGNGLAVLGRMDIPGLDMLSSDPMVGVYSGWMTAAMPSSAAILNGRRRVMTEVSDFSQKMAGKGPVDLAAMRATAAWQAAWGVTDFTLYYRPEDRSEEDYQAYCGFVGRLNAALKPARRDPHVLLYYPIYDLWAEYRPVAERLSLDSQSPRARQIADSLMRLGRTLQQSQIPFCLVDHVSLGQARVESSGAIEIAGQRFDSLVLPAGVELSEKAATAVEQYRQSGGRVLADDAAGPLSAAKLIDAIRQPERISPPSPQIVLGRFVRDGRTVLLLTNVGDERYEGRLATGGEKGWRRLDPASADIEAVQAEPDGKLPLVLGPRRTLLFVSAP